MSIFFKTLIFCTVLLSTYVAKADVTVALITPKAGSYEQQGKELELGVQKAIEQINNNGGLLGEKLKLLTIDDQCNDGIAVSTAQMLTLSKEKVKLVIGPYCANAFDKVADIYAKAQIFQIIPTTVNYAQAKTIKKGLVKMLGYTNEQAKNFFDFYNTNHAGAKLAIISNKDDEEGTEEVYTIINEFKKHGKSVVLMPYTYDMTEKDYDELADMVLADGNEMAFILGYPKNIKKMAYALKKLNNNFMVITNKYAAGKDYFDYMGDLAEGTYFMALSGKDDNPEFAETLVKLRLNGFDTEGISLYGYSAVNLWRSLVQISKSFEYNALSNNLNHKNIKTEFGSQMFHNGTPDKNESYSVYIYDDKTYLKVY